MKVLFSLSYNPILNVTSGLVGDHEIITATRSSDWGKSGYAKYGHYVKEAVRILRHARGFDALVLCNLGIEAFVIGRWRDLFCPRTTVICVDLLMPRESRLVKAVRPWIQGIDAFVCIRSGDIPVLGRRFGIPARKCHFTYFPINPKVPRMEADDEGYVYSAGWAHRDWPTLVAALSVLPYRAILSVGVPIQIPDHARDRIEVLPMLGPDTGRECMAKARLVVLSFLDTDLPSGPLVLLDAMAMAKPIVVTNVNGTRDYVTDGATARLVPPGDSQFMASAICSVMDDPERRQQMASAARADVFTRCTTANFINKVLDVCTHAALSRPA